MHTGHYISGAGHLALLAWLAFGDVFAAEPLPFEMSEVSVISGADYAAMVAAGQSPQSATEVAQPASPEVTPDAPQVSSAPDEQTELASPAPAETPGEEAPPDVSQITPPPPQADVSDQAPELPLPPADLAVDVPQLADTAVPEAVDRVAPEAVAQPDPEARPDPVEQEAVAQDEAGTQEQEPAEATAPEAAATEIVTEAEKPATTLTASPRPPARPKPPAPQTVAQPAPDATPAPAPAAEPEPSAPAPAAEPETPAANALNDALAEAMETPSSAPAVTSGPPLTAGEKETLRVAVSDCWNVGSLSTDALRTTVVVTVSMTQDGKPVTGSIRMTSSSGGSDTAARQAFEAARRAIIRCGASGFDLPAEKFGQWQEIEMTFNPERMRVK